MEIGESLVGAYLREVVGCQSVNYNTYLPDKQGEIEVIGVRISNGRVEVRAVEVAVHLNGLDYGGYAKSASKVGMKMAAARSYVETLYPAAVSHFEFWSPAVPPGLVTKLHDACAEGGFDVVLNSDFTERVVEVGRVAAKHTKMTGNEAFRVMQLLTHLKGEKPVL